MTDYMPTRPWQPAACCCTSKRECQLQMNLNFEAFLWQRQTTAPESQLFFQGPGLSLEIIRAALLKCLQVLKLPAKRR